MVTLSAKGGVPQPSSSHNNNNNNNNNANATAGTVKHNTHQPAVGNAAHKFTLLTTAKTIATHSAKDKNPNPNLYIPKSSSAGGTGNTGNAGGADGGGGGGGGGERGKYGYGNNNYDNDDGETRTRKLRGIPRAFQRVVDPPPGSSSGTDNPGSNDPDNDNPDFTRPKIQAPTFVTEREGRSRPGGGHRTALSFERALRRLGMSVPPEYQCALCSRLVSDPVLLPWDVEQRACCSGCIRPVLASTFTCPVTGLDDKSQEELLPYMRVREGAEKWREGVWGEAERRELEEREGMGEAEVLDDRDTGGRRAVVDIGGKGDDDEEDGDSFAGDVFDDDDDDEEEGQATTTKAAAAHNNPQAAKAGDGKGNDGGNDGTTATANNNTTADDGNGKGSKDDDDDGDDDNYARLNDAANSRSTTGGGGSEEVVSGAIIPSEEEEGEGEKGNDNSKDGRGE